MPALEGQSHPVCVPSLQEAKRRCTVVGIFALLSAKSREDVELLAKTPLALKIFCHFCVNIRRSDLSFVFLQLAPLTPQVPLSSDVVATSAAVAAANDACGGGCRSWGEKYPTIDFRLGGGVW